jgi:membrane-bound lytic murein transglycosylase B
MKIQNSFALIALICSTLTTVACAEITEKKDTSNIDAFIQQMVTRHHFNKRELDALFESVEIKENILKTIAKPAEAMPWYKYRKIFMTDARINAGVKFWQENAATLKIVEQRYGVPAEIITAIIGVETSYGQNTGNHRVIDALSTLAFAYPPRSKFFLSELENFLLLCREENISPLKPTGSYAGAMGIPQFMPSSFRTYAADFDNDQFRDIWHNNADVIASVANYFAKHHWQPGQAIAFPAVAKGDLYKTALNSDLKPTLTFAELQSLQIETIGRPPVNSKLKLLAFELETNQELWVALDNFYVITRYNHSPLYAMAVFQLSQAIANKKRLLL